MAPLSVSVWTLWHGAEIAGEGTVELLTDEVHLWVPAADADLCIPLAGLDGARGSAHHLSLYSGAGDVVELTGSRDLEDLCAHLTARACTMPELTLALRGLGSARAYPGPDHDRFFAPILAARRTAQRASNPEGRLSALRAPALAAELERTLHGFAVDRFPNDASERRAFETVLEDLSAPVRASLAKLNEAARSAAAARDDIVFVWWRAWAAECRALFAHLDRCWLAVAPVLKATPLAGTHAWRWPWQRKRGPSDDEPRRGAPPAAPARPLPSDDRPRGPT